ncbi:MAG: HAMP domain-containing histidine kinase [Actinobacteria bacterium]|nr:HAMP domain-containing histidine kinase [Actinomycetota bacterium]
MIELAAIVALATLVVGTALVFVLQLLPTVRLQLAGLALLGVTLPLASVLLSGLVMFHMGDDVKILAVTAASASVALGAAFLLARSIADRVASLGDAATDIAAGDLGARANEGGPRELAGLARAFNAMAEDLGRLFDARRELVAWASHDLRTPIAALQAMIEAIEDGLVEPGEYLPAIQQQVRTLSVRVDDLFELARIDAGALTLELRDVEVADVVEGCVHSLEAEAAARGVRLETRATRDAKARCEPDKVERVLLNLITNALHHTPTDGSVAVLVESREREIKLTVADTGVGLEAGAERRMFEPFWRGDSARSADGAGLGLAIARGLVEAHGGRIWAERRRDGGALVSFTLPAA